MPCPGSTISNPEWQCQFIQGVGGAKGFCSRAAMLIALFCVRYTKSERPARHIYTINGWLPLPKAPDTKSLMIPIDSFFPQIVACLVRVKVPPWRYSHQRCLYRGYSGITRS